jgi:hypothetical protein
MIRTHRAVRRAILLASLCICSARLFGADFTVALRGPSVVAEHATPNGDVAFFSETVSPLTYFPAYYHAALTMPANGNGESVFSTSHAHDQAAIWIAVDIETGAVATATGSGVPAVPFTLVDASQKRDVSGQIVKMQLPFDISDLLIVRPGQGAWHVTAIDGGPADEDHTQNGKTAMSIETLVSFKKNSKPPHALKKGDVIVAIEARSLRYSVLRVKE